MATQEELRAEAIRRGLIPADDRQAELQAEAEKRGLVPAQPQALPAVSELEFGTGERFSQPSPQTQSNMVQVQGGGFVNTLNPNVNEAPEGFRLVQPASSTGAQLTPAVFERIPAAEIGAQQAAQDVGLGESLAISFGKGLSDIGRGVGTLLGGEFEQPDPLAFQALQEERPVSTFIGETSGQIAPALPLGVLTSAIRATAPRVLATGALTGGESAAITAGQGGTSGETLESAGMGAVIGAGAEFLFPILGRIARKAFERVTGSPPKGQLIDSSGNPTQELQEVMDQGQITREGLIGETLQEALEGVPQNADPEQLQKFLMLKAQGLSPTKGELTGDFAQRAKEQELLFGVTPESVAFRSFMEKRTQDINDRLRQLAGTGTLPAEAKAEISDAMESMRSILIDRKKTMSTEKSELYRAATEARRAAGGVQDIPLFTDAFDDLFQRTDFLDAFGDISATDPEITNKISGLLARFGIRPSESFTGETQPLTLTNFERLSKALKRMMRDDASGTTAVLAGPILETLEGEVSMLADHLRKRGFTDQNVLAPLREAQELTKEIKTTFDPKTVVGQLLERKPGSTVPKIEASAIYNRFIKKPEELQRIVSALRGAGEDGAKGLSDLQTALFLDVMDTGFRGTKADEFFNIGAALDRLDAIGSRQLKSIFSGNPRGLEQMQNLQQALKVFQVDPRMINVGSAPMWIKFRDRFLTSVLGQKVGAFANGFFNVFEELATKGKTRTDARQAINAVPEAAAAARQLIDRFPSLATALGLTVTVEKQTGDNNAHSP